MKYWILLLCFIQAPLTFAQLQDLEETPLISQAQQAFEQLSHAELEDLIRVERMRAFRSTEQANAQYLRELIEDLKLKFRRFHSSNKFTQGPFRSVLEVITAREQFTSILKVYLKMMIVLEENPHFELAPRELGLTPGATLMQRLYHFNERYFPLLPAFAVYPYIFIRPIMSQIHEFLGFTLSQNYLLNPYEQMAWGSITFAYLAIHVTTALIFSKIYKEFSTNERRAFDRHPFRQHQTFMKYLELNPNAFVVDAKFPDITVVMALPGYLLLRIGHRLAHKVNQLLGRSNINRDARTRLEKKKLLLQSFIHEMENISVIKKAERKILGDQSRRSRLDQSFDALMDMCQR